MDATSNRCGHADGPDARQRDDREMNKRYDISGKRFGLLIAIRDSGTVTKQHLHLWECRCDCGREALVARSSLTGGNTQSCGCLHRAAAALQIRKALKARHVTLRHGHSKRHGGLLSRNYSPEYMVWQSMVQRCHNPNSRHFETYGGRGISVTRPWRDDFRAFLNDMGYRLDATSIDRIDGRFGYFAANCRWAMQKQQQENKRPKRRLSRVYELFPKLKALKDASVSQ